MSTGKKQRERKHPRQGAPGWAWLLAGLVAGLFVAFLVYLQGQQDTEPQLPPIPKQAKTGTTHAQQQAKPAVAEKSSKPRFDFYTILPEMEIPVPEPERRTTSKAPAPPHDAGHNAASSPSPATPGSYMLQLGSFRNRSDADRLRARIAMLGFEPHIQTVNIDGSNWYRVRIGPYRNSVRIAEIRNRLHQSEFDAILLKLKE